MHIIFKVSLFFLFTTISLVNAKTININDLIEIDSVSEELSIDLQGKTYNILRKLGAGNTTTIFEIENNNQTFALRIPKGAGNFNTFSQYKDYINAYRQGHDILEVQNVSVPKLYSFEKDQYLIVEKLNLEQSFDLHDLFFSTNSIDEIKYKEAVSALDKFAKEIAPFKTIKDFHLKQALYIPSQKKWRLMDWTLSHELFDDMESSKPLTLSLLKSAWSNEVYYRENPMTDGEAPTEYKVKEDLLNLFENLDNITNKRRQEITQLEEEFLVNIEQSLKTTTTAKGFVDSISKTPENFSNKYVNSVIDLISQYQNLDIIKSAKDLPHFLYSDNNNYIKLISVMIKKETGLDDLLALLELRENVTLKLDWPLELKIQKLITENTKKYSQETYQKLLKRKLITDYAKAWIKREFLAKDSSKKCSELVKAFL